MDGGWWMVVGSWWWVVAEEGEGEDAKQCLIKQKEKEKEETETIGRTNGCQRKKEKKDESQKSNKGTNMK